MILSTEDLIKIEKLLSRNLEEKLDSLLDKKLTPLREDILALKDIIVGVDHYIETEQRIILKSIEENTKRSKHNKKEIGVMKQALHFTS